MPLLPNLGFHSRPFQSSVDVFKELLLNYCPGLKHLVTNEKYLRRENCQLLPSYILQMTLSYLFKRNNLSTFNERRCCYATTQVHSTDGDRKSKGSSLFSQQPLSALVKIKSLKSHNRMSFLVRRDSMTQSHCRAMNQLFMLAFCCARHWVQFFNFILVLSGRGGASLYCFERATVVQGCISLVSAEVFKDSRGLVHGRVTLLL